jgi:hypothetical protein
MSEEAQVGGTRSGRAEARGGSMERLRAALRIAV